MASNRGPSSYQPNALPLGQTGSKEKDDDDELMLMSSDVS